MRGEVETFLFPVLHWAWPIVHCIQHARLLCFSFHYRVLLYNSSFEKRYWSRSHITCRSCCSQLSYDGPDQHFSNISLSTKEFCQRKSLKFLIRNYFHRKSVSPCGGRDRKFILHCRCSHLLCRTSLIKCEEWKCKMVSCGGRYASWGDLEHRSLYSFAKGFSAYRCTL